jgi:hypothetical protein
MAFHSTSISCYAKMYHRRFHLAKGYPPDPQFGNFIHHPRKVHFLFEPILECIGGGFSGLQYEMAVSFKMRMHTLWFEH